MNLSQLAPDDATEGVCLYSWMIAGFVVIQVGSSWIGVVDVPFVENLFEGKGTMINGKSTLIVCKRGKEGGIQIAIFAIY